jgi:hypothetical protein
VSRAILAQASVWVYISSSPKDARHIACEFPPGAKPHGIDENIEIALEFGFSNASHFARFFRSVVGQTPSQYRQAA